MCTKVLFRALEPELEAKAERYPLEVLEAEHGLEAAVPDVGRKSKIRSSGIVLKDKLRVEPAVAEPERSEPI